jgi:hypothetical protein
MQLLAIQVENAASRSTVGHGSPTSDGAVVVTHVAYTDESSYNFGRYRSLAMISMPVGTGDGLSTELADILNQSGIREAKWNRVKTARDRFASQKLLRRFLEHACDGTLRGDALIWDTWDRRHAVAARDDMANFGRMYHHLCRRITGPTPRTRLRSGRTEGRAAARGRANQSGRRNTISSWLEPAALI